MSKRRTRQQRRMDARETARLLVRGEPQATFRWEYTLALLGVALSIFLVLMPPEDPEVAVLWLIGTFGVLVYPALHLFKAVLPGQSNWVRLSLALVFLVGSVCVLGWWILRPVGIELRATSTVPLYGPGTVVSGIEWKAEYSQLNLMVRNTSRNDYGDLDVEITTDLMFEDLRPQSGLASCNIGRSGEPFEKTVQKIVGGVPVGPANFVPEKYAVMAVGKDGRILSLSDKTNRTYRIRCEHFPADSQNTFVAALSVVNPMVNGNPPLELYGPARPARQFSARVNLRVGVLRRSGTIAGCQMAQTCKS